MEQRMRVKRSEERQEASHGRERGNRKRREGSGSRQGEGGEAKPKRGGREAPRERGGKWGSRGRERCKRVIVPGHIDCRQTIVPLCVVEVPLNRGAAVTLAVVSLPVFLAIS